MSEAEAEKWVEVPLFDDGEGHYMKTGSQDQYRLQAVPASALPASVRLLIVCFSGGIIFPVLLR